MEGLHPADAGFSGQAMWGMNMKHMLYAIIFFLIGMTTYHYIFYKEEKPTVLWVVLSHNKVFVQKLCESPCFPEVIYEDELEGDNQSSAGTIILNYDVEINPYIKLLF